MSLSAMSLGDWFCVSRKDGQGRCKNSMAMGSTEEHDLMGANDW